MLQILYSRPIAVFVSAQCEVSPGPYKDDCWYCQSFLQEELQWFPLPIRRRNGAASFDVVSHLESLRQSPKIFQNPATVSSCRALPPDPERMKLRRHRQF